MEVGWQYLLNNTGSGFLPLGGSYVTLVSPDGRQFSTIIESMRPEHSQCIRNNPNWNWTVTVQELQFKLEGELKNHKKVRMWESNLIGEDTYFFHHMKDIEVKKVKSMDQRNTLIFKLNFNEISFENQCVSLIHVMFVGWNIYGHGSP